MWHETLQLLIPGSELLDLLLKRNSKSARQIEPYVNFIPQDESIRRPWKANNFFSREETSFL